MLNQTVVCGQHFICQEIVLPGESEEDEDLEIEDCAPAIDCALAALAAGKSGTLRWRRPLELGHEIIQVHLVGDGTAFRSAFFENDLNCYVDPVERYTLHDATLFASCTKIKTFADRFKCLMRVFEGDTVEMCTEGVNCSFESG